MTLTAFAILAQLTLTCDQVRTLYYQLGPEAFRQRAAELGLSQAQMKAAMSCIRR
jgi:hypothetical protein